MAVASEVKFAPLMVSVKAAPPAVAEVGLRIVMEGDVTSSAISGEAPPVVLAVAVAVPAAVLTETVAVPAVAARLVGTTVVTCVALT